MVSRQLLLRVYEGLFLGFCIIIPFEEYAKAIPNILIGTIAFFWFFVININELLLKLKSKAFIFLTIFIAYITLNSFAKNQFYEDIFVLKKFLLPFVIILLAIPINKFKLIKRSFVASTTLAVLISIANITEYVYLQEQFVFSLGKMVNELLVSERLYIGFCSVISLVFLIDDFRNQTKRSLKTLIVLTGVLLIFFVFLTAARIAIISMIVILFLFITTQLSFKKKIIASTSLLLFITIFFSFNQNLTKRFFRADDKYRKTFFAKIAKHEPRFIIWNCSAKIIEHDLDYVYGNGFNYIKDQLVECYKEDIEIGHKRDWFVESRFNTHNQFLDIFMSSGIIGFLLFMSMLFYAYKQSNQDIQALSLFSSLFLILLVDNIFHRQIGDYLFALIYIVTSKQTINPLLKTE